MMLLHAAVIGAVLYLFMIFALGQQRNVSENRSILIASCVLIYMILFGHGLPLKMNKLV
jgi:ABC-type multidrug transport system permease subunit